MTRTAAREIVMRLCFEISAKGASSEEILQNFFDDEYYKSLEGEDDIYSEPPDEKQREYIERLVKGLAEHSAELDRYIEKYATGWQFDRISRTAVAIMKTAMFEILYAPDVPQKAAVNEAVEMAKKYEEPSTVPFINGVLGAFIKGEAGSL